MIICHKEHRHDPFFSQLPDDQKGDSRHKCAGCAYEKGYELGLRRDDPTHLNWDALPESQASEVRHKSAHYAFAVGYQDGLNEYYQYK